jgi:transcriptional regulator with XRE-family HTH domain
MNDRIKHLRKDVLKMSQKDFAESLNLSENFVWMIEKGNRIPSDRTISDICRIFSINEDWLRNGIEPMRSAKSREEEIAEMVGAAFSGSADFKQAVIKMICSRTPEELHVLEKALTDVYDSIKKEHQN